MFVDQRSYPDRVVSSAGPRSPISPGPIASLGRAFVVAAATIAAAGCSANITRFDQPSFALNEGSSSVRTLGAGSRSNATGAGYDEIISAQPPTSPPAPQGMARVASLPVSDRPSSPPPAAAPKLPRTAAAPVQAAPVAPRPVAKGDMIEVQPGDSLFGIAKRHHVMISELMAANDLKNPTIKPGQKLYLPAGGKTPVTTRGQVATQAATQVPAHAPLQPAVPRAAPVTTAAAADPAAGEWSASYTVKSGDSIYAIASHHHVKAEELQRVNGITDVRKIKPGIVLKVPGERTASVAAPRAASAGPALSGSTVAPIKVAARTAETVTDTGAVAASPANRDLKIINGAPAPAAGGDEAQQHAALAEPAGLAAAKAATSAKLRWPVQGRVVQGFGPRADGSQSDGVDVAVPLGTEVLAAEAGTVAYAGSEVKTYGNLVLIRHDNGLVTAYAYNEQILVQRGDRVKRGQPIAKAGKSGNVDQPQLHFEVRVGTKPVDPLPYLEKS